MNQVEGTGSCMPATKIVAGVGGGGMMCALLRGGKRSVCIQRVLHIREPGQVQYSVAYLEVVSRSLNAELELCGGTRGRRVPFIQRLPA